MVEKNKRTSYNDGLIINWVSSEYNMFKVYIIKDIL